MKELPFLNQSPVYLEISHGWLKALRDDDGLDLQLERGANGALTTASKEAVVAGLRKFVSRKSWLPRVRAVCAIGAGGVSLRRLVLPKASREELAKLVRLQIEAEFPLPPEELAWGFRILGPANAAGRIDLLVGAVKKDRVEEYAGLLLAAGLNPVFTPAALARAYLGPQPPKSSAWLDLTPAHAELALFEQDVPVTLRVFPLGPVGDGRGGARVDALAKEIGTAPRKVFVTGANGTTSEMIAELRAKYGIVGERLEIAAGAGHSAAVDGMRKASVGNDGPALLLFQTSAKPASIGNFKMLQPVPKPWAIAAAVLLVTLLALPFAEALVFKSHLSKKVAALKSGQGNLAAIDHEYDFLRFIKQNGPPYLDALYLFAKSAPPGARIESVSMNRRGDLSLRGSLQNGQLVTDFRAKLIDSGFFDRVTVEEQVPTPDRQKVNVRITAQWKPVEKRIGLAIGPTRDEIEKAKTNALAQGTSPSRGGMPPGMSPGMPVGMPAGMPPGVIISR